MSTKKQVRDERRAAELHEKKLGTVGRVGLMAALVAALSGPMPVLPTEDPRRPRDPAAWTPTPEPPKRTPEGEPKRTPEGEPKRATAARPKVYLSEGAKVGANLYVRTYNAGTKEELVQLGNRLKDRRRKLEQLLAHVGVKPTPRQVKRCDRGHFPPPLLAWLLRYKAWKEEVERLARPEENAAEVSNAELAGALADTLPAPSPAEPDSVTIVDGGEA